MAEAQRLLQDWHFRAVPSGRMLRLCLPAWLPSLHLIVVTLLLMMCVPQALQSQDLRNSEKQAIPEADSLVTITKVVDEVDLNFTVTDRNGRFVSALQVGDFRLLDNSRPPERLVDFQARTESPIRAVLLFDISSSIRYRFAFEVNAANHFLRHVLRPGVDEAAIVSFGSDVREVQSMTGDLDKLTAAVANLKPGGMTALRDAIIGASKDLRSAHIPNDTRKVIVIISDGADTASQSSAGDCREAAISSEAIILVVDASVPSESNSPSQVFLREIAESSGGFVLPARLNSELKSAFRTIETVLRNQYALSYKPALFQRNGTYRTVELSTRKRGLVVHARKGYFAGPN